MNLSSTIKNWFEPAVKEPLGGPDFDDCEYFQLDYGLLELEVYAPRSHITPNRRNEPNLIDLRSAEAKIIKSKYDNSKYYKKRNEHRYISELPVAWSYRPKPKRFSMNEPYVVLTANWQVQLIKNPELAFIHKPESLQNYFDEYYDNYYNGEGGPNWQCHKDTMEFYNPLNISNEERDKLIKAQLKRKMRTSPDDYEVTCINEIHWLKYSIKNTINILEKVLFSVQVSPEHMLTVSFNLTRLTPGVEDKWLPSVLKDIDKIMQGTYIHWKELGSNQKI